MKTITVISRASLKPNSLVLARKWYSDWENFIKSHSPDCNLELLALNDDVLFWIEKWSSKAARDKFVSEHLIYSEHFNALNQFSYPDFTQDLYKKIY